MSTARFASLEKKKKKTHNRWALREGVCRKDGECTCGGLLLFVGGVGFFLPLCREAFAGAFGPVTLISRHPHRPLERRLTCTSLASGEYFRFLFVRPLRVGPMRHGARRSRLMWGFHVWRERLGRSGFWWFAFAPRSGEEGGRWRSRDVDAVSAVTRPIASSAPRTTRRCSFRSRTLTRTAT